MSDVGPNVTEKRSVQSNSIGKWHRINSAMNWDTMVEELSCYCSIPHSTLLAHRTIFPQQHLQLMRLKVFDRPVSCTCNFK